MDLWNHMMEQNRLRKAKNQATISLVFGILSFFPGYGLFFGIVGIVLACLAKKEGYASGLRTAGFVLSIIGAVLSALILLFL